MVQTGSNHSIIYAPPQLPEYLASTHGLKAIVGAPADDDVNAIHAAIRAVNSVAQIPALGSQSLAVQLSQHLFDVQMAVYRSRYTFSLLQEEITYTPPTFPSHIPIALEPVVGSPSDEQITAVHNAVRDFDTLARVPSLFDSDLSMKLSQHLFNIQLARHIQESNQIRYAREPGRTGSEPPGTRSETIASPTDRVVPDGPEVGELEHGGGNKLTRPSAVDQYLENQLATPSELLNATRGEITSSSHLLRELRNIHKALITTQFCLTERQRTYSLMNYKGELPEKHRLPKLEPGGYRFLGFNRTHWYMKLDDGNDMTDSQLAAYLRFYNIGVNLIGNQGDGQTVIPSKKQEAERILWRHMYADPGSGLADLP